MAYLLQNVKNQRFKSPLLPYQSILHLCLPTKNPSSKSPETVDAPEFSQAHLYRLVSMSPLNTADALFFALQCSPRRQLAAKSGTLLRIRHQCHERYDFSNFCCSLFSKAVASGLASNRIEFDTVKIRIIECLPRTKKLDGISVAKPVWDNVAQNIATPDLGDIRRPRKSYRVRFHYILIPVPRTTSLPIL